MRFVSVQSPHSMHTNEQRFGLSNLSKAKRCLVKRRYMSAPTYRPDDPNMGARVFWLEQVSEAAKVLSRSQVPNQFSGNTVASKISFEPEPSVVRGPAFDLDAPHARSHLRSRTKVVLIGGLVSILSLVDLTAITTIGQSTFADAWQGLALDRTF